MPKFIPATQDTYDVEMRNLDGKLLFEAKEVSFKDLPDMIQLFQAWTTGAQQGPLHHGEDLWSTDDCEFTLHMSGGDDGEEDDA